MISKLEENKVLRQIYRWFSFYEKDISLEKQLEILSDNISIDSGLDKVFGKKEYIEKVKLIPDNWKSLYKLSSYNIEKRVNGSYIVETLVEYDNIGVEENMKSVFSYMFSLKFEKKGKKEMFYPLIQSVKISTLGKNNKNLNKKTNIIFDLLISLNSLIGRNKAEVDEFKEILRNGFILNFNNKEITMLKMLRKYLQYNSKEFKEFDFVVEDFQIKEENIEVMVSLYTLDRKSNENIKEYFFNLNIKEEDEKIKIFRYEKI